MEKNKFHILVVDDDDKLRSLIKQFLSEKGFIVSSAENAEKAKAKIEFFNFNLIILDVMMPGQSGYELTKELKESKNIPIILLTAKGEVENRIHGLELGADDYLGKPFEPKELISPLIIFFLKLFGLVPDNIFKADLGPIPLTDVNSLNNNLSLLSKNPYNSIISSRTLR